jgi:CheY-like chemotaxis protein
MHNATVLLVDNYRDALDTWALFLRMRGYRVVTATGGGAAIELAVAHGPDVIVLDLVLPDVDGCDVARTLRVLPATRHIPIVATTSRPDPDALDAARAVGFARIMIKPCDPWALVDEIDRAAAVRRSCGMLQASAS